MRYEPLTREEVRSVIEGRGAARRVPVLLHCWTGEDTFGDRGDAVRRLKSDFVQDAQFLYYTAPGMFEGPADDPGYCWANHPKPTGWDQRAIDDRTVIADWSQLDGILAEFPSGDYPGLFHGNPPPDGRYRLGHWWYCLFERHWSLRGMTNALTDYHTYPDEVHRLFKALTKYYLRIIERAKAEGQADGIYTTDDIGMQTGPFFSPLIFDEFYRPYYKILIDRAHELGMNFWLHTCGNVEIFLPKFIELGLDVIHPIQKYSMDERSIAAKYGGQIAFWAGFDIQQTIPRGTPQQVRAEVRHLMDTYHRPDGRLLFTAGNMIHGDCPLECLRALYEEAYDYGTKVVQQQRR
jgi:hypothetical protein